MHHGPRGHFSPRPHPRRHIQGCAISALALPQGSTPTPLASPGSSSLVGPGSQFLQSAGLVCPHFSCMAWHPCADPYGPGAPEEGSHSPTGSALIRATPPTRLRLPQHVLESWPPPAPAGTHAEPWATVCGVCCCAWTQGPSKHTGHGEEGGVVASSSQPLRLCESCSDTWPRQHSGMMLSRVALRPLSPLGFQE